jgi:hypothetical protein
LFSSTGQRDFNGKEGREEKGRCFNYFCVWFKIEEKLKKNLIKKSDLNHSWRDYQPFE